MHKITGYDIDMNEEIATVSVTVSLPRKDLRRHIDRMPVVDAAKHPNTGFLTAIASEVVAGALRQHGFQLG